MTSTVPTASEFRTRAFQNSLSQVAKGSNQVMIYGWGHCGYDKMTTGTEAASVFDRNSSIKRVFSFKLGNPLFSEYLTDSVTTLEGRRMNLLDYARGEGQQKSTSRKCKTAITNVVLENYKRQKEGLSLIPVIFAIDISNNPKPCKSAYICSKDSKTNDQVTHKEIRRAYKLCTHPNPKIRAIALQTFKFAKVSIRSHGVTLQQIAAPWAASVESPEKVSSTFDAYWQARKRVSRSKPKPEKYDWSKQLEKHIARYDHINHMQAAMVSQALQTKQRLEHLAAKLQGKV